MSETYFSFPQKCCVCMGSFQTNQLITESKTYGATQLTSQIYVPVCNECKKKHFDSNNKLEIIVAVTLGLICGLIGLLIGLESDDLGWFGGIIVGGIVGFIIAAFFISVMNRNLPVRIRLEWQGSTRIEFENKEYQKLFDEMNKYNRAF